LRTTMQFDKQLGAKLIIIKNCPLQEAMELFFPKVQSQLINY
jgi:hypothetical protein